MTKNPRLIDMSGRTFGRWTVCEKSGNHPRGGAIWRCICDCGTEKNVSGADLRSGRTNSCGCYMRELSASLNKTHGKTGTRLYRIWQNMKKRCQNERAPNYSDYGGRGIRVCPEWSSFETFEAWSLANGYADDLSIERKNVDGHYDPGNCTWATAQEQSENRRFVARAPDGRLWLHVARDNGVSQGAYRCRLHAGWSYEDASSWPMGKKRRLNPRNDKGQYRTPTESL